MSKIALRIESAFQELVMKTNCRIEKATLEALFGPYNYSLLRLK